MGGNSSNHTLNITVKTAAAADNADQEVYLAAMLNGEIYWVERGETVVGDELCKTAGTYSLANTGSSSLVGCYQYTVKPYATATSFGKVSGCAGNTSCSGSLSFNLGTLPEMGLTFVVGTGSDINDLLTYKRYKVITTY